MQFKRSLAVLLVLALLLGAVPALAEYNMPYYIEVDLTNQIVTIYNTKDNTIARQMLCSAGVSNKTPTGTWYMPNKERDDERTEWYWMPNAYTWVKWPSKIYYAYFFHSIPFNRQDDSTMNEKAIAQFGNPASHGCIRLRVEDAYFIAKNCKVGTRVHIYKSGEKEEDLRALLYVSSYTGEDGMSYSEFLGISEDDLGRGCTGNDVLDLQHRLNDLGYYDGAYDGNYGNEMVSVVKQLQKDLGLSQTGISTKDLLEVIYSDDAPVSTGSITFSESQSGPVVKQLQSALKTLGVYTGPVDSVYDVEVSEAVKTFQNLCGLTADGVATPDTQHAVYYVLAKVQEAMGGEEFTISYDNEELATGRVNCSYANILVRSKPSTDSASIGKVKDGDLVTVLATQDGWAQIVCDAGVGYIYKKYLKNAGTTYNYIVNFTSTSGKTYTLGATVEQRLSGGNSLAAEIRSYYSSADFMDYLKDATVSYTTVNTGSDDVSLNLRAQPDAQADVLSQVANGTSMRVLEKGEEWTKVAYNGGIGYLMNQYLSFWQGTSEDESDVLASQSGTSAVDSEMIDAIVILGEGELRANIYAEPAETASVLARAPADLSLKVVSFNEDTGWVLVDYNGNRGYMKDANLSFSLGPTEE